ncbi:cupin domain-containing protein [Novosphingobium sp.]|uniref:cupin domain-containing protein n=1 Tax=Novosphingobium sp. TaxID=1874826 RepID=UPI00286E03A4|nr:cupin domain-containing protein [Novosphingobium sp.]
MDVVKFADAPFYFPPNHEGVAARRMQGDVASGADFAWVGYSDFPPGVIVPMEAGAIGKIYVVTQGALTIVQADGVRHRLEQWDSIFIPAGEARAVENDSGAPAAIIVVTPPPAA